MQITSAAEEQVVERLGEIPWVIVSVNFYSGNYSLDFIPITKLPKEEYYPLSDRVLLSKDSAVYLEGAQLDWSPDLSSFFLVPPFGSVQISGGGTFTYH